MTSQKSRLLCSISIWAILHAAPYTLFNLTSAAAEEMTWARISTEFEITVSSLSSARKFAKNCNIDMDNVANAFISAFADLTNFDRNKIEKFVAFQYQVAQDVHSRDCKRDDLQFWMKTFDTQSARLFRNVAKYNATK